MIQRKGEDSNTVGDANLYSHCGMLCASSSKPTDYYMIQQSHSPGYAVEISMSERYLYPWVYLTVHSSPDKESQPKCPSMDGEIDKENVYCYYYIIVTCAYMSYSAIRYGSGIGSNIHGAGHHHCYMSQT